MEQLIAAVCEDERTDCEQPCRLINASGVYIVYIRREMFYTARSEWENRLFSSARRKGAPNE